MSLVQALDCVAALLEIAVQFTTAVAVDVDAAATVACANCALIKDGERKVAAANARTSCTSGCIAVAFDGCRSASLLHARVAIVKLVNIAVPLAGVDVTEPGRGGVRTYTIGANRGVDGEDMGAMSIGGGRGDDDGVDDDVGVVGFVLLEGSTWPVLVSCAPPEVVVVVMLLVFPFTPVEPEPVTVVPSVLAAPEPVEELPVAVALLPAADADVALLPEPEATFTAGVGEGVCVELPPCRRRVVAPDESAPAETRIWLTCFSVAAVETSVDGVTSETTADVTLASTE